MALFRSAMKQVARRHGYLVSFMCRPRLPNSFASGWHLHQSLLDRKSGKNLFVSSDKSELLSPLGQHYLAGLLAHARAAAAFTTPTINGYKRYHGVNSMAPIQAIWASDNRGVMVRVLGEPGDAVDASGEPRRRAARQSVSLHGVADPRRPRRHRAQARAAAVGRSSPTRSRPSRCRSRSPRRWPRSTDSACFRAGFGDVFVDYHLRIKQAEIARCDAESGGQSGNATEVTAWEHKEYFDLACEGRADIACGESGPKTPPNVSHFEPVLWQKRSRKISYFR